MKLSVCLAVYNEAENIHYPLDSIYEIADEIVIVDGGSTDDTVKIALSYGSKVKIVRTDNPSMFHKNKQIAIDKASGEWILQIDADEAPSFQLKKEIIETINQENLDYMAFWIPRKNWFLTKFLEKGGQYPDYTIRLYKNGVAKFPCQDVHENVKIIKGKIGYLKNPILHYADPDFSRYLKRWDRYTTLVVEGKKFKTENENKNLFLMFLEYFFWKPAKTFFLMFFRHKGFMDGFPGFVFALFSSIRFWVIYVKWWQKNKTSNVRY